MGSSLCREPSSQDSAGPKIARQVRRANVEVDIFHGRQSYEVGAGISISGKRYALSEIVRTSNPDIARHHRNPVATTPEGVVAGLNEASSLMQEYGTAALRGDIEFVSILESQRKQWAESYSLDVLAGQIRPRAEDAFRRGEYSKAAELYSRIRERLRPAEAKKLALAEERRGVRGGDPPKDKH